MIRLAGSVFSAVMNFFYWFFKRRKTQNKIALISRQSETPSTDFRYLTEEMRARYPAYEIACYCKMIPDGIGGKIRYVPELFRQMKAMATAKVVVLDGYCILASVLHHKKDLTIIQFWHALGAFKKFGKSILDKEGGKSSAVADAFKMHRNYDLIAVSGEKCVPAFAEAFGQSEEKFVPIGIPRMDYLTDDAQTQQLRERIYDRYPMLQNGKKTILYVPTFRDTDEDRAALAAAVQELISAVNYSQFNLIVKHHVVDTNREEIYTDSHMNQTQGEAFTGMEFMAVADYVITDYSSVIFEALLKNLPLYLFCFDSDKYIDERGFYIDFWRDIPALYAKNARGVLMQIAEGKTAPQDKIDAFKNDYVNKRFDSVTAVWCTIIDEVMRGVYDHRYNYQDE